MIGVSKDIDKKMFKIFLTKVENFYNEHLNELRTYVETQKALGLSEKDIIEKLVKEYETGTGFYERVGGKLQKEIEKSMSLIFQTTSNDLGPGLYRWVLDPTAEHCDSCLYQSRRGALPIDKFPIPGSQETHGETNCDGYCKCTLEKVEG